MSRPFTSSSGNDHYDRRQRFLTKKRVEPMSLDKTHNTALNARGLEGKQKEEILHMPNGEEWHV